MKKKRKLAEATEQAYNKMNDPLVIFLLHTTVHLTEASSYGQENDMTFEESLTKTQELMAKIQEEFDKIHNHLDSIEMSNDQIEANLEYANMILTGASKTTH